MTSDNDENEARIFPVETRFQELARRPGGVPRDEAIERAQTLIEERRPSFYEWLDRELATLAEACRKAAAGELKAAAWAEDAAIRTRHIRDVGTTMGFDLLTFVANNLSEMLEGVAAGAEYRADLVECHLEAMLLAKQDRYRNMRPEQLPELSGGLRQVLERASIVPSGTPE
jgi:hypothetical protein